MIDIFSEGKEKVMPEWAKFAVAGDKFQGTYVGKIIGQIDGYGNEQTIYQLLQEDGKIINVGFGLNKKVLHSDMHSAKFGQIVGFKYNGKVTVKDKFGKPVEVKDISLFQDPKIVNEKWLAENKENMPEVIDMAGQQGNAATVSQADRDFEAIGKKEEDIPFSSKGNLTNEDKLVEIVRLAKAKLNATDADVKDKVMESLGIAFIPVQYDNILEKLSAM